MKIILLQDIAKLGKKFDMIDAADGYALNYLIPNGLAEFATPAKEQEIEKLRENERVKRNTYIEDLTQKLDSLKDKPMEIKAKANEKGVLFAGIEKEDIMTVLKEQADIDINAEDLVLKAPIKDVGEYTIPVDLEEKEGLSVKVSVKSE